MKQGDLFQPPASDAHAGWKGAVSGMEKAAAHTESELPGWQEEALAKLIEFVTAYPGREFIAPDVRKWAEEHGLSPPATNYAWGNVFRVASKDKIIRGVGYRQYGDTVMHTQSVRVWIGI